MAGFTTKIIKLSARGRAARSIAAALAALTICAALAASAGAAGTAGQTGGSNVVITPKLAKIQCRRACARKRAIQAGSLIRITGKNLAAVGQVIFLGARGAADDTTARVIKAGERAISLRVPADATSGRLVALGANGARSRPSAPVAVRPLPPVIGTPDLTPVAGFNGPPGVSLDTGTSTPRVVFFGARQLVRFSLRVTGAAATAGVALIRQSTGETIVSWSLPTPAGQIVSVDWNGMAGALPAAVGRYAFRVSLDFGTAAPLAVAAAPATGATDSRD
ncbi:MAG: hypothetical protein JJE27_03770, partial [Thermoleophilia bacterium]|nr:hypothetical protein [Thermoleophilia bacterium]